jgi:hypothetical protein
MLVLHRDQRNWAEDIFEATMRETKEELKEGGLRTEG